MSAIWGIINFNKSDIDKDKARIMKECFSKCAIDRYEELFDENVYMGCGIQYITKEAEYEKAPTMADAYYFVSDSIVDNRAEICEMLSIENDCKIPDGEILEKAVMTFGEKAFDYVRGAYTFVKYNKNKNEVFFAGDHLGQRTVYYMIQDKSLFFASLMEPLKKLSNDLKPNEDWLSKCIIQNGYGMHNEEEQVPYFGMYRIAPATYIRAHVANNDVKLEKTVYWNPCAKRKKIKYKTDEEYKTQFRNLYEECVECLLRSSGETAILLSGGYDSSSVAAWAAKELDRRGKKLYSFTSVPMDGYVADDKKNMRHDESEAVVAMAEMYKNIVPTFMKLPNMDIWGERTDYMNMLEMPYKSPENLLWMYYGEKMAREKGARILLTGVMGNATVSYGIYELYLRKLIFGFRWLKYWREVQIVHKRRHASRKTLVKFWWDVITKHEKELDSAEICRKAFIREEYAYKYGAVEYAIKENGNLRRMGKDYNFMYDSFFTYERMRTSGDINQHTSLMTGVVMRDPTRDVRMIEFCRSLPISQYVKNAEKRRLISIYMKDMLPKEVLYAPQGLQSADAKMRILNQAEQIKKEWINNYDRFLDNPRIDCKMALEDIREKNLQDISLFELMKHVYTNVFLEFIDANFSK